MPPIGTNNLSLPCGRCLGCKTARAAAWANRATHEASLWPVNTFVTLTYDDAHLPYGGHLVPEHLQKFLKRLRAYANRSRGVIDGDRRAGIRFLACGEYGDRTSRPHYHAVLFNAGFSDAYQVGDDLAESPTLNKLWPYGSNRLSPFVPARANYVAQYTLKKIGTDEVDENGVVRPPPFLRCSLRPGIGSAWLDKFREDLAHGYLVDSEGRKAAVPRSYLARLRREQSQLPDTIAARSQAARIAEGRRPPSEAELRSAELIHKRRLELMQRRAL